MHIQKINQTQAFSGLWGDKSISNQTKPSEYQYKMTSYEYYPFENEILEHPDTFEASYAKLPKTVRVPKGSNGCDEYHKIDVQASLPFTQEEYESYKNGTLKSSLTKDLIRAYAGFTENPPV